MADEVASHRGAHTTALNAVQALGRGFDVTCDIRLLYCKGTPGSRLVVVDEEHTADLKVLDGLVIPKVSTDIRARPEKPSRPSVGVQDFDQMSELFNKRLGIGGKIPSGIFNAMFSFSGSWQVDASMTKSLALDGVDLPLYSVHLRPPFILCEEVKKAVPSIWDPAALASFIEKYGTHIIMGVEVGGKDIVYVKQHQSSSLAKSEVELQLRKLVETRFQGMETGVVDVRNKLQELPPLSSQKNHSKIVNADSSSSLTGKEDITVIYRRRGGDDLVQDHLEWKKTVYTNPDVLSMWFFPIVVLLDPGPSRENLSRAIEAYTIYKPPLEELQYFLEFQVPRAWAPATNQLGLSRKEPVCPSLQFSLMGPKLFISTDQVSVGRKPITGLRLCLEGSKLNRLAVHVQHLTVLPKILQPHWDAYVAIGAPKWHGPEEQDSRWFEPVLWKNFAHVSTAPVEFSETWFGDASGAYIVTGAQLGVWDFGMKSVLHLKLLYSKVPGCTIRRSVWDHTPTGLQQSKGKKGTSSASSPAVIGSSGAASAATQASQKLSKFVDTTELARGPQDLPGHWLVTGAKLCVEKSNVFLRVKYSLLNY
ncbi:hypothetical protein GOP47_0021211 [Adiantum capillus-veneris]|uniref:MACPF domain-containing protein n=1 Tax=Adiantum capillus-veneris TaxID=13818 RepID=A0A9D4Z9G0_ADICA|nr:hypothetical protein GOP47_0021211 [Adiantum capillus-veneris]